MVICPNCEYDFNVKKEGLHRNKIKRLNLIRTILRNNGVLTSGKLKHLFNIYGGVGSYRTLQRELKYLESLGEVSLSVDLNVHCLGLTTLITLLPSAQKDSQENVIDKEKVQDE